ncbi:MAG: sugar phosphate isomerase/epimerase [Bacteroidetes bacterium]|nr:sugar phosphate isomerase/epimerase [Bacteroidota bacterium]
MKKLNRRDFLNKGAMGIGGALALSQLPQHLFANSIFKYADIPLGFQTFPIRDRLSKDFPGTLKTMADFGYKYVELCSPQGYKQIGFGFLADKKPSEIKQTINDAGLTCQSCHFGLKEFTDTLDASIQFGKDMGFTQMICSTFWLPKTATVKDYEDAADKLNAAGEKIKQAGMQCGFHNHEFEFNMLEGQLIYDVLMKRFNPELVKMQFQTEVINLGYKASTYFEKYPGRFISAHLSDWTTDKKETPVGKGVIDWKGFFAAAKTGGVKNFFVEMNFDTFKDSAAYIKSL